MLLHEVLDNSYIHTAWILQIYNPEGLKLQQKFSVARQPTNGTMNLSSHTIAN